jgi:hypothetical protein
MPRGAFYVITRKEIAPSANLAFYGMAGERAAAKSAGSGGNRPATHTTDASPRPAFLFGAECSRRGVNPRQSPPRGFSRGGGVAGRGRVRFSERHFGKGFSEEAVTSLDCSKD